MTRVVVVGDLVTDIVVQADAPFAAGSDTPARIITSGGGAGANTACWLGVSGVDVALVARIGADEAGRARSLELFAYGVDGHLAVDGRGQRSMLADRGASTRLQPRDLPTELFAPHEHLHLSGYLLLHPDSRDAGLHTLSMARRPG